MDELNILVLSVGTRNKIIQYLKTALEENNGIGGGKIIATDMSAIAPAIYEADKFYQVPRMTEPGYIDTIFDICKKENVNAVLSLIDPELSLLAKYEDSFKTMGVTVIGSSYELCEKSLDKMEMYKCLSLNGYKTARSYDDISVFVRDYDSGKIQFPVFVKPIKGSASLSISRVDDMETLELLCSKDNNLMIQEYMRGQEVGADVYIDLISGEVVSIFTKKKLVMRAGETDKAISFKDERLFHFIERFVHEMGYRGQIDIDIFDIDGEYYISEVNPRFGGGYPHAYECGCNHMKMIVNNLKGIINVKSIGCYENGICMMKYNELMVRKVNE